MNEQQHMTDATEEAREYLTVAEFAKRAGVSYQAVYERIKKDLSNYCTEINGKKMIDTAALEFVGNRQTQNKAIDINLNQSSSQYAEDLIQQLKDENARLIEDIRRKDEAIADKDKIISTYAEKFATMLEREQEIARAALNTTGQAQLLQAINTTDQAEQSPTPPSAEPEQVLTLRQRLVRLLRRR